MRRATRQRQLPRRHQWGRMSVEMNEVLSKTIRYGRRLVVSVVGITVLGIGVVLLVTPGPAVVVIPIGLGILSLEFVWARRLLRRAKACLEPKGYSEPNGEAASAGDAESTRDEKE